MPTDENDDSSIRLGIAAGMCLYGGIVASLPTILRLIIRDSTSSDQLGSGLTWFLALVIFPSFVVGALVALAGFLLIVFTKRTLRAKGTWAVAASAGIVTGLLAAYPLGSLVSSPQIPIAAPAVFWLSGGYFGLACSAYILCLEYREKRNIQVVEGAGTNPSEAS